MNVREPIYETNISDERWWAYDVPGNLGWIAYLACLFQSLKRGLNTFNMAALLPGGLMLLGVGELISERIAGLDRVLPKRRLLRGFGALTVGGIGGMIVSVLGTSSGGNLALGMVPYINDRRDDTPMPSYIMAISPGTCVDSEAEWQKMLELDEKDVVIPAQYMKTAVEVMRHGDDSVPDYMIWLQRADFTGCPPVTLIYGTDETLYACAPAIEAALKKSGAFCELILGEGLFHCYPVFPIVKEAREGWRQMVERMIRWRDKI